MSTNRQGSATAGRPSSCLSSNPNTPKHTTRSTTGSGGGIGYGYALASPTMVPPQPVPLGASSSSLGGGGGIGRAPATPSRTIRGHTPMSSTMEALSSETTSLSGTTRAAPHRSNSGSRGGGGLPSVSSPVVNAIGEDDEDNDAQNDAIYTDSDESSVDDETDATAGRYSNKNNRENNNKKKKKSSKSGRKNGGIDDEEDVVPTYSYSSASSPLPPLNTTHTTTIGERHPSATASRNNGGGGSGNHSISSPSSAGVGAGRAPLWSAGGATVRGSNNTSPSPSSASGNHNNLTGGRSHTAGSALVASPRPLPLGRSPTAVSASPTAAGGRSSALDTKPIQKEPSTKISPPSSPSSSSRPSSPTHSSSTSSFQSRRSSRSGDSEYDDYDDDFYTDDEDDDADTATNRSRHSVSASSNGSGVRNSGVETAPPSLPPSVSSRLPTVVVRHTSSTADASSNGGNNSVNTHHTETELRGRGGSGLESASVNTGTGEASPPSSLPPMAEAVSSNSAVGSGNTKLLTSVASGSNVAGAVGGGTQTLRLKPPPIPAIEVKRIKKVARGSFGDVYYAQVVSPFPIALLPSFGGGSGVAVATAHSPEVLAATAAAAAATDPSTIDFHNSPAYTTTDGPFIAVKDIIIPNAATSKESNKQVAILQREIYVMQKLNHKNIVKYLGSKRNPDGLSIFMEFADGGTVGQYIKDCGKLSEAESKKLTLQLLNGLEYLHQRRIVHRDLKGDNLFLMADKSTLKVGDFGTSKEMQSLKSATSTLQGTPNFMAPEIVECSGHGIEADIWSVGCCVIQMVTGRPPFRNYEHELAVMFAIMKGKIAQELPKDCSDELKDFLSVCTQKSPKLRWNCAQLKEHVWVVGAGGKTSQNPSEAKLKLMVKPKEGSGGGGGAAVVTNPAAAAAAA